MHTKCDADLNIDSSLLTANIEFEEIPGLPEIPGLEGSTDLAAHSKVFKKIICSVLDPKKDPTSLPPVFDFEKSAPRSQRVTIRVPTPLLAKFKKRASRLGVGYQTLMIRELTAAANGGSFGQPPLHRPPSLPSSQAAQQRLDSV
jgi:hypothetical protein